MSMGLSARKQDVLEQFERKLGDLKWDDEDEHAEQSLNTLYQFTIGLAMEQVRWYARHRSWNRRGAIALRAVTIVALLIGLSLQVFALNMAAGGNQPPTGFLAGFIDFLGVDQLRGSYIYLGLAGILLFADRWIGWSKAWIRHTMAWLSLSQAVSDFHYAWALERRAFAERQQEFRRAANVEGVGQGQAVVLEDKAASTASLIELLHGLASQVQEILQQETETWSKDYDRITEELSKRVKTEREALKPRSIEVKLTRKGKLRKPVTLSLDGMAHTTTAANSYLFTNVMPGSHIVEAEGQLESGEKKTSSTVVTLAPGKKVSVPLTLEDAI